MAVELAAARQAPLWRSVDGAELIDDVRRATRSKTTVLRTLEHRTALARELGSRVASEQADIRCDSDSLASCRIVGATALVTVGTPRILGDSAVVDIVWHETTQSMDEPLSLIGISIWVRRTRAGWAFLRYGAQRAS